MSRDVVVTMTCDRCGRKHKKENPLDTGDFGRVAFDLDNYRDWAEKKHSNVFGSWPEKHEAPEICPGCLEELYEWWIKKGKS